MIGPWVCHSSTCGLSLPTLWALLRLRVKKGDYLPIRVAGFLPSWIGPFFIRHWNCEGPFNAAFSLTGSIDPFHFSSAICCVLGWASYGNLWRAFIAAFPMTSSIGPFQFSTMCCIMRLLGLIISPKKGVLCQTSNQTLACYGLCFKKNKSANSGRWDKVL